MPSRGSNKEFLAAARMYHAKEGEIEFDEGAKVSKGEDDGAYVQAWVWVPNWEVRGCKKATHEMTLQLRRQACNSAVRPTWTLRNSETQ